MIHEDDEQPNDKYGDALENDVFEDNTLNKMIKRMLKMAHKNKKRAEAIHNEIFGSAEELPSVTVVRTTKMTYDMYGEDQLVIDKMNPLQVIEMLLQHLKLQKITIKSLQLGRYNANATIALGIDKDTVHYIVTASIGEQATIVYAKDGNRLRLTYVETLQALEDIEEIAKKALLAEPMPSQTMH